MPMMGDDLNTDEELEVVNIVGSGDIGREIDIRQLQRNLCVLEAEINEQMHALLIRFEANKGLIILYRTGKYIIRGGSSRSVFEETNNNFLSKISELGVISDEYAPNESITNIVYSADLGNNVELERLMLQVGMENAEFEPEQFPGLIYRPEDEEVVILIFSTGKVLITGTADEGSAARAYSQLRQQIKQMR
jgi:transcription initiation factor TFIID TATA-box-binding protein